jgi:hypothetical protein
MIKQIYSNGPYLQINQSNPTSPPYINNCNPSAGILRYNGNRLEVYDGTSWFSIGGDSTTMISLTSEATETIMWAQNKMHDERRLLRLAEEFPAVKDALNKLKSVEDELKVITALVEKQGK